MFNMPHEETPKGIEFDMSEQLEAARWFEEASNRSRCAAMMD